MSIPTNPEIPTLIYFPVRGRGDVSRLILEESGEKYQEVPVGRDWEKQKEDFRVKGYSAQGKVPIYMDKEIGVLSEASSINQYLAKKYGFFGKNIIEEARILEIVSAILEIQVEVVTAYWDPDVMKQRDQMKSHFKSELENLENFIFKDSEQKEFLVGDSLSLADFQLTSTLDSIKPFIPEILSECKKLEAFRLNFHQRKRIHEYCASDRRPKTFTVQFAFFGGKPEQTQQGDE